MQKSVEKCQECRKVPKNYQRSKKCANNFQSAEKSKMQKSTKTAEMSFEVLKTAKNAKSDEKFKKVLEVQKKALVRDRS